MMASLVLQAALQVDTVVTVPARDAYDVFYALAAASLTATFLAVLALIAFTILQIRKATRAVHDLREQISLDPAVESLRGTAKHVESAAESFDREATRMSKTISDRLTQASDRLEERIEEFNALMEVVQSEAEGTFVDSASAARGIRAGLESLGSRDGGKRHAGRPIPSTTSDPATSPHPSTSPSARPLREGGERERAAPEFGSRDRSTLRNPPDRHDDDD